MPAGEGDADSAPPPTVVLPSELSRAVAAWGVSLIGCHYPLDDALLTASTMLCGSLV